MTSRLLLPWLLRIPNGISLRTCQALLGTGLPLRLSPAIAGVEAAVIRFDYARKHVLRSCALAPAIKGDG
jgi:hypothetical protein